MSDYLSKKEKAVSIAVAILVVVSALVSLMLGNALWIGVLVGFGIGWRYIPGFWRTVLGGVAAGVVAGVLVLGPGFRLAMRVVAILDPIRAPEFTLGGTFFILIFVGGILGGAFGLGAALMRRGLTISGRAMAGWTTVVMMGLLLSAPDLRSEFADLGTGPWVNVPMFGVVVFLYGILANRLIDRFEKRTSVPASSEPLEVQA